MHMFVYVSKKVSQMNLCRTKSRMLSMFVEKQANLLLATVLQHACADAAVD